MIGSLQSGGEPMVALNSPHEATEVGGLCSGVWKTMFYVPGADGGEVELGV